MNFCESRAKVFGLCSLALLMASTARAELTTASTSVSGSTSATVSGTGSATLNGVSGTYKQWVPAPFGLGFHTNIGISAGNQTVGLSVPTTSASSASSATTTIQFDPNSPPSPYSVDSLNANLLGGSGIPINLNVNPINVTVAGVVSFGLQLNFSGSLSSLTFTSSGPSDATTGVYNVPGTFHATLQGSVTGTLVSVPLVGSIGLGTVYTLAPTTFDIAQSLPGLIGTSDATGGSGPYPADLDVLMLLPDIFGTLSLPVALPFNFNTSSSVPNGSSGISDLNGSGAINANLVVSHLQYSMTGVIPGSVVPEFSSIGLVAAGLAGLAIPAWRRRRSA